MVEERYPALRIISTILRVLAWVVGVGCALGFVGTLIAAAATQSAHPALMALILAVYGVFGFIYLYAGAEAILVFLDIEENTRRTAASLARMTQPGAAQPQPPAA
jgi:ABC-type glucose/galactose transport system permease subunit